MIDFEYRIYEEVYNDIIKGIKNIEFRLLNDKSEKIKKGDRIKFSVLNDSNKYITVEVLDKYIYENIDDLWNHKEILNNNILSYSKDEFIKAFNNIFDEDKASNSKIVGIKFKVLN